MKIFVGGEASSSREAGLHPCELDSVRQGPIIEDITEECEASAPSAYPAAPSAATASSAPAAPTEGH